MRKKFSFDFPLMCVSSASAKLKLFRSIIQQSLREIYRQHNISTSSSEWLIGDNKHKLYRELENRSQVRTVVNKPKSISQIREVSSYFLKLVPDEAFVLSTFATRSSQNFMDSVFCFFNANRLCCDFLCFWFLQAQYWVRTNLPAVLSLKIFNMAAVLAVNGCAEVENLLQFCNISKERIRVEEQKEFTSPKVGNY